VPVEETFLRRHVTDDWPQHMPSCEFYREPAELVEISVSYRLLPKPQVPLRSFEISALRSWSAARLLRLLTGDLSSRGSWGGC